MQLKEYEGLDVIEEKKMMENYNIFALSDSEADGEDGNRSILQSIRHWIANSSLLLFPQGSMIRNWCQMCVISDEEMQKAEDDKKEKDAAATAA